VCGASRLGEKPVKLKAGKSFELPVVFAQYSVTLTNVYPKVDGENVLGYCHYEPRIIKVRYSDSNAELSRATIWHEWFHAAFRELGRGELSVDEALVDGLANALMRVRLEIPEL
jgi:hypothetical protein